MPCTSQRQRKGSKQQASQRAGFSTANFEMRAEVKNISGKKTTAKPAFEDKQRCAK